MILHALHDLYARLQREPAYCLAAPGFSLQKIGFKVVITLDGNLVEFQDIRVADRKRMRPKQLLVPGGSKSSGSGINPGFLWDNTGYMLGFIPKGKSAQRTQLCFEAFRQRHLVLEKEIATPAFSAVCSFLRKWTPEQAEDHAVLPTVSTSFGAF